MSGGYLIDTNILVLAIRGRQRQKNLLIELLTSGAALACSSITLGETFAGMRQHERQSTEELFDQLIIFDVTAEIARYAGLVKNEWASKRRTLSLADAMIAATAILHRHVLITDNRKDFRMPELQLYPDPIESLSSAASR
jgi:predicted nucleic acid-binding protein